MKSLLKKIVVTTLLICGSWFSSHAQSNVVPDNIEFEALKAIYDSLGGANWTNKTNWPTAGNWPATATAAQMGTWYGVTVVNGDVTKIIFTANKLIGFVPTHVGNLQRLEMMTFANDKGIVGAIPSTIGNLLLLKSVNFAQCNLTRIPASLFNLTGMTSLALHENNISGALPSTMGNATSLVALTINNNKLSGSIPTSIGALINLTSAKMQYNAFTGAIPSSMGNLVKLTYLSIDNNQLTGSIPASIGNLTKLTVLSLKGNQLSGSIPDEIGNLVELQTLTLFRNQLSGAIPSSIGALHKLTFLDLSSNQITGAIPDTIGGLTLLSQLLLNSNKLSGVIPSSVSGLTNLAIFTLNDNQLSGSIPVGIGNMTGLTNLQLQGNKLTGSIPASFGNMTKLTTLQLHNNQLTGKIPAQLGNLANLQYLYLNDNKLTGEIPPALGSLSKLVQFMVYTNQLEGAIPASFSGLTKLNQFYVYNNKLSGSFPSFITGWTTLGGLMIYNNNFSGPFPEVTGLTGLTGINATGNSFTSIPNSILTLPSLSYVQFENNQLTYIPNFSTYSGKANLNLFIKGNRLNFYQLEPLIGSGIKSVGYMPLNTINDQPTINLTIGGTLFISASPTGASSTVTWEKQKANGQFDPIGTDQDNNPQTYTLTPATTADEGIYRWKMTNTKVTGVTLYSDPIAVKTPERFVLDNWAFQYKYDGRKRMTHKKVPGVAWVYMVYDDRDRLVLTQDGEQRKTNKWSFTKYDALNRPVMTGIYTHTTVVDQATMQGEVNNFYPSTLPATKAWYETVVGNAVGGNVHGYDNKSFPKITDPSACLTISYYDNYNFLTDDENRLYKYVPNDVANRVVNGITYRQPTTANTGVIGQVTGTKVRKLDTYPYWFRTVSYYDDKYRSLQVITEDHIGELQRTTNLYDFVGKVLTSKTSTINQKPAWANAINVNLNVDQVTPVTNSAQWASGVSSGEQLAANQDGWIEATVVATNSGNNNHITFGFSVSDVNTDPGTITYSWRQLSNAAYVTEGTAQVSAGFPTVQGDVLRIERIGSKIYYKRNGVVMATNNAASTAALVYDNSLFTDRSVLLNPRASFATANTKSITRMFDYDHAGRLMKTWHGVDEATPILLAHNEYNELGQLIDKKLHSTQAPEVADASRTYKQSTDYRYNIRGWLTSINNAELTQGSNNEDDNRMERDLFGMELAYEKPVITLTYEDEVEYNGNISAIMYSNNLALGTIKSNGYKFDYDPMNRLKESNFRVKKTDWALPEFIDEDENTLTAQSYSETGFDYDLNGNIKHLTRSGKGNTVMDVLTYDYGASNPALQSNQLLGVKDNGETTQGFIDGNLVGNDYSYDVNGNMLLDKNKAIMTSTGGAGITYNHLNLPDKVLKSTGDYIRYIYDATGKKLSQQVYNVSNVLKKRSDYVGEYFYENDTLKFINHEEGRIVMVSEGQPTAPEYQYHLKDHLGNVRTTFTTKEDVTSETATMEEENREEEEVTFLRYELSKRINSALFDHTNGNAPGYAVRLNGTDNEQNGLTYTLSVMPGDVVNAEVYAKYLDPDDDNWTTALNTFITQLPSSGTSGIVIDGSGYMQSSSTTLPFTAIDHEGDEGTAPKAYLNYIFINRDYDPASVKLLPVRMTEAAKENGTDVDHELLTLSETITEPGYVYIYLSNDNLALGGSQMEVYFDDFKVTHTKSPIVQQEEYYPFGLTFNGYQRESSIKNNHLYNGKEIQDELNVGWLDYGARMYIPEIVRWGVIDPLSSTMEGFSPYGYAYNNPVSLVDIMGLSPAYNWETKRYEDNGKEITFDEAMASVSTGKNNVFVARSWDLNVNNTDEAIKNMYKSAFASGSYTIFVGNKESELVENMQSYVDKHGKIDNLIIANHSSYDDPFMFLGETPYLGSDLEGVKNSAALAKISSMLNKDATVFLQACYVARPASGGEEFLKEVALKLKATVIGSQGAAKGSVNMFDGNYSQTWQSFKPDYLRQNPQAASLNGKFTKVTLRNGEPRVTTVYDLRYTKSGATYSEDNSNK